MPPEKIPAFVKDHERARDSGTRSPALQLVRPQPAVNAA
jgi:hypothetical protein